MFIVEGAGFVVKGVGHIVEGVGTGVAIGLQNIGRTVRNWGEQILQETTYVKTRVKTRVMAVIF